MKYYINKDQSSFIQGRQQKMCGNSNMVHYIQKQGAPALVIFCDAEKAFDRVQWDFIEQVLVQMGFGEMFRKLIRLFYAKQLWISLAGSKSKSFRQQRGMRQGCTPPPLILDLVIDVLALSVWQKDESIGIENLGRSHKLLLYADDIILTVQNPLISIQKLSKLLERFGEVSEYKINHAKSALNQEMKDKVGHMIKVPWKQQVKYLGVKFTLALSH